MITTISNSNSREIWGVLGGIGPLASAEFLRTIYRTSAGGIEQDSPVVIVLSDPRMPDRTASILAGNEELLLEQLSNGLNKLLSIGATRLVVCCVTLHPFLSKVSIEIQQRIVSLVDVIFSLVLSASQKHLLICTKGTRVQETFERHKLWARAKGWIVYPNVSEQDEIHQILYEIKGGGQVLNAHIDFLKSVQKKYGLNSYIAGCTEAHIMVNEQARLEGRLSTEFCIDPLREIAAMMSTSTAMQAAPWPGAPQARLAPLNGLAHESQLQSSRKCTG